MIPQVSVKVAKAIAARYPTFRALMDAYADPARSSADKARLLEVCRGSGVCASLVLRRVARFQVVVHRPDAAARALAVRTLAVFAHTHQRAQDVRGDVSGAKHKATQLSANVYRFFTTMNKDELIGATSK